MSRATKRKHVLLEQIRDDYSPPEPPQSIVQITTSRGNNLHEVKSSNGDIYLVSMPTKFRKNVWVKRGDFVIVEPIEEGDKVKAEIVRILTREHVKYFKKDGVWPDGFCDAVNDKSEQNADDVFVNPNKPRFSESESGTESDSDTAD